MKKKILFAAACITGSALFAQDSSKILNPVIITANKFPQKQSTTGKVITVITKDQIEKSTGKTVAQLLNEQAGVTINGALNNLGSNQTVYMRGASAGRTLILIDGIPQYDPSFINNDFDLNLLSLNNIESIEICRGAQSTLYGSDALAGVINIITVKKDITKPFNVKATASAGNYGTYRGNVQLYGKADKLTYSARYAKLSSKGFSAAYDKTGAQNFDNDKYNGDVASAMLQYQLSSEFSVKTFIQYSHYKTSLDAAAFTDEKDYTIKNKSLMAGAGFHYQKNNINVTGNYQYSENKRNYLNDSGFVLPGSFVRFSKDDYFGKSQFAEIFSSIGLNKNFTLLEGADYRFSNFHSYFFTPSFTTSPFRDTSHSQASLYASLLYHAFAEKLNIELGGRLNVHSRYGSNSTYTFNPSYNIDEHYRFFGSIATGFKAPSLYQLYAPFSGNANLKPEKSQTYEIGFQQQHAKITNRIVYFNRKINNGLDYNNNTNQYFNFAKQTVNGIEFESKIIAVKNFTITANYTYLKAREENESRITFKDSVYKYLLRRPQHSFNISAAYNFNNGLYISASGKYVGKRYDAGGYKVADIKLDNYFLLNAYAEYKFNEHLKLFADLQNITNKKFFDVAGYNSIPFLFNGGVTVNF